MRSRVHRPESWTWYSGARHGSMGRLRRGLPDDRHLPPRPPERVRRQLRRREELPGEPALPGSWPDADRVDVHDHAHGPVCPAHVDHARPRLPALGHERRRLPPHESPPARRHRGPVLPRVSPPHRPGDPATRGGMGDRGGRHGARRVYAEKAPFAVLAAVAAVIAFVAIVRLGNMAPLERLGLPERLAVSVFGLAFYLWKTLLPVGLSPLYGFPARVDLAAPRYLLSFAVVGLVSLLAVVARHRAEEHTSELQSH